MIWLWFLCGFISVIILWCFNIHDKKTSKYKDDEFNNEEIKELLGISFMVLCAGCISLGICTIALIVNLTESFVENSCNNFISWFRDKVNYVVKINIKFDKEE